MGHVVIVVERKGATVTVTTTMPRQRFGSGNSIEIPMQRRSMRMHAKDGGALPDTGCPT